jgi:hypothetical protein
MLGNKKTPANRRKIYLVGATWMNWNLIKQELINSWQLLQDIRASKEMVAYGA